MYRNIILVPSTFEKEHISITAPLTTPPGLLARLFILASKYQIPPLQNDIIDAFLVWLDDFCLHHRIPGSVIQYVWENTASEDCMLRQFLVDYVHAELSCWDLKEIGRLVEDKDFGQCYALGRLGTQRRNLLCA